MDSPQAEAPRPPKAKWWKDLSAAVLLQAGADYAGAKDDFIRDSAISFLFDPSCRDDFLFYCHCANINPSEFQDSVESGLFSKNLKAMEKEDEQNEREGL